MNKQSSLEFLDHIGLAKMPLKEKVLLHVERNGPMRFTEIQRFMVDLKFGAGTYDSYRNGGQNPYRGWYCSYFYSTWQGPGLFMTGEFRLTKVANGLYQTARH